jgi:riboflavin kinase/FMN adenylyltransferase
MGRLRGARFYLGPGHRFGKGALGDAELLRRVLGGGAESVREIAPVEVAGETVSSSEIRHRLKAGKIEAANAMLGRPYALPGIVERGAERGRSLGFPTANLRLEDALKALPAFGVYGGEALVNGRKVPAIGNIGMRPTFGGRVPSVEAHLLGVDENLYGCELSFELRRFLRPERPFSSPEELKSQISEDVRNWEKILAD